MNEKINLVCSSKACDYLKEIGSADILVGMPSFNNVITASFVISQIIKGLDLYFPNLKSVIFVSDGGSGDETLSSVKKINMPTEKIKIIPTVYVGTSGKGTAIRAIFEAALFLEAKSVALVDSDLRSITPEWMRLLITPTLTGTDFVSPLYNRRKYDGTITNFLCYPVTAALYGKNIRQPIGGDFGLSSKLIEDILNSPLWSYGYVSRFGIDIFETHTALARGYQVKEALLGVKNHDPKDPSSQLAGMFRQVIGTMFTCINKFNAAWEKIRGISEVEKFGESEYDYDPDAVEVSFPNTINAFKTNYDNYTPIYRSVLNKKIQNHFEKLKKLETSSITLPAEMWAETVYNFIKTFQKKSEESRELLLLLDALRILWIGKVASFMKDTWEKDRNQAEAIIRDEAKVFAKLKPQFLET